jgi:hypothetical protein
MGPPAAPAPSLSHQAASHVLVDVAQRRAETAGGTSSAFAPPASRTARSQGTADAGSPGDQPDPPGRGVFPVLPGDAGQAGREDPFAPLVLPQEHEVPALPSSVGLPIPPGPPLPPIPDEAPLPVSPVAPPPAPGGGGMKLAGIISSGTRLAIIEADGKSFVVGVGQRVEDAEVVSISPDKVVLKRGTGPFELTLGGESSP